jgi:ribosomal 50S subunit-recycling heat shock protein
VVQVEHREIKDYRAIKEHKEIKVQVEHREIKVQVGQLEQGLL